MCGTNNARGARAAPKESDALPFTYAWPPLETATELLRDKVMLSIINLCRRHQLTTAMTDTAMNLYSLTWRTESRRVAYFWIPDESVIIWACLILATRAHGDEAKHIHMVERAAFPDLMECIRVVRAFAEYKAVADSHEVLGPDPPRKYVRAMELANEYVLRADPIHLDVAFDPPARWIWERWQHLDPNMQLHGRDIVKPCLRPKSATAKPLTKEKSTTGAAGLKQQTPKSTTSKSATAKVTKTSATKAKAKATKPATPKPTKTKAKPARPTASKPTATKVMKKTNPKGKTSQTARAKPTAPVSHFPYNLIVLITSSNRDRLTF